MFALRTSKEALTDAARSLPASYGRGLGRALPERGSGTDWKVRERQKKSIFATFAVRLL